MNIGNGEILCPEAMFRPELLGKDFVGVHKTLNSSITTCEESYRNDMYSNIVMSGGNTMFVGMDARLQEEMTLLAPAGTKVKVIAKPERQYSVWMGGSMIASMPTFQHMWISKEDYDEEGPSVAHRKCY